MYHDKICLGINRAGDRVGIGMTYSKYVGIDKNGLIPIRDERNRVGSGRPICDPWSLLSNVNDSPTANVLLSVITESLISFNIFRVRK